MDNKAFPQKYASPVLTPYSTFSHFLACQNEINVFWGYEKSNSFFFNFLLINF